MLPQLGDAHPPILFDDQPKIVIYHENEFIARRESDLGPFHKVAILVNTADQLGDNLRNQNGSLQVVLILPRQAEPAARNFVHQEVLPHPNATQIVPFFLDGGATDPKIMNTDLINACHPIDSDVMAQTRVACAKTNNDNISYCLGYQNYYEGLNENSLANLHAIQALNRVGLNLAYLARLTQELNLDMVV